MEKEIDQKSFFLEKIFSFFQHFLMISLDISQDSKVITTLDQMIFDHLALSYVYCLLFRQAHSLKIRHLP